MLVKTDGIILRQIPFSESSIIVKIFTRDFGLISFLVKGAKSKKNPKANILKPINQISFSFYQKENKGLRQFKEFQLIFAPDAQLFGIYKSAVSMMMVELLNTTITEDSMEDIEKYEFLEYSFNFLREQKLHPNFYLSFIYQYSIHLGIEFPSDKFKSIELAYSLAEYHSIHNLVITKSDRKNIFKAMDQHFFENLTNYKSLKSIAILEDLFT